MRFLENIRQTVGTKAYVTHPTLPSILKIDQQKTNVCFYEDVDVRTNIHIGLSQRLQRNDTTAHEKQRKEAEKLIQDYVYGDIRRELIPLLYEVRKDYDEELAERLQYILELTDLKG